MKRQSDKAWGFNRFQPQVPVIDGLRPEGAREDKYNPMASTLTNLLFHVVFTTKMSLNYHVHQMFPNAYFAKHGLFTMKEAHALACQPR